MKLVTCELDASRTALLREELADVLARTTQVPDIAVHVVSLTRAPSALPADLRAALQVVCAASKSPPSAVAERLVWEQQQQTYQLVASGNQIWVVGGGDIGCVYGFYELLRRAAGVRWYGLTDQDICFAEPVAELNVYNAPAIVWRGFEEVILHPDAEVYFQHYLRWMVRHGWNLILLNAAKWQAFAGRQAFISQAKTYGIRLAIGAHAPEIFLPETMFESHPEWFCYRDGARRLRGPISIPELPGLSIASTYQPCYTNPETRLYIAEQIAAYVERFPETDIFSLWPHDGINNWCQCERCLATVPYAAMHLLALDVAERLPAHIPVEVLCYSNMLNLPTHPLPVTDRTYTLFCPYLRHYHHRFYDPGFAESELVTGTCYPQPDRINPLDDREYGVLLEQWQPVLAACGSQLGIFAYYQLAFHDETHTSDASRYLCRPDPQLIADEIDRFQASGARVFYDCSHPSPGFWPDGRLYAYLPQLLWNPQADVQALVAEFYRATLGEAGPEVERLIAETCEALGNRDRPLPASLTARLETTLAALPGTRGERYRMWLDYLKLGDAAWHASKANDWQRVIALEDKIIALLDTHTHQQRYHLECQRLARYSHAAKAHPTGKATGALPD